VAPFVHFPVNFFPVAARFARECLGEDDLCTSRIEIGDECVGRRTPLSADQSTETSTPFDQRRNTDGYRSVSRQEFKAHEVAPAHRLRARILVVITAFVAPIALGRSPLFAPCHAVDFERMWPSTMAYSMVGDHPVDAVDRPGSKTPGFWPHFSEAREPDCFQCPKRRRQVPRPRGCPCGPIQKHSLTNIRFVPCGHWRPGIARLARHNGFPSFAHGVRSIQVGPIRSLEITTNKPWESLDSPTDP